MWVTKGSGKRKVKISFMIPIEILDLFKHLLRKKGDWELTSVKVRK